MQFLQYGPVIFVKLGECASVSSCLNECTQSGIFVEILSNVVVNKTKQVLTTNFQICQYYFVLIDLSGSHMKILTNQILQFALFFYIRVNQGLIPSNKIPISISVKFPVVNGTPFSVFFFRNFGERRYTCEVNTQISSQKISALTIRFLFLESQNFSLKGSSLIW